METREDRRHFESKSIRERLIFKQIKHLLHVINCKYTPYNGKEKYDVTGQIFNLESIVDDFICEIKIRNKTRFSGNGYVIEKPKYDYLMSRANEFDKVYYINIFFDGIIVYDLKTIAPSKLQWKLEDYNKNNHSSENKTKLVDDLMTWDAEQIIPLDIKITEITKRAYEIWDRINKNK
jgi:hypothetical protein